MSIELHINGYLVKSLSDHPLKMYPPLNPNYKGIGRYTSWPLDQGHDTEQRYLFTDAKTEALRNEAWERWFGYANVLELVPESDFLLRYTAQCSKFGIETIVMRVETPLTTHNIVDNLPITEYLGFDCIDNTNYSLLSMDTDYYDNEFVEIKTKLNSNGLFTAIADVYEYIEFRNKLIEYGLNLETASWGPFPARLSFVTLDI